MYSPRLLLIMVAALCVADAAFLQNFNLGRRADSVSPTESDSKASSTGSAASPTSTPPSSSSAPASTTPPPSSSTSEPSASSTPSSTPAPTSTPTPSSTPAQPTSTPAEQSSQQPTSQPQPTGQPTSQEEPTSKSTYTSFVISTTTPAPSSTSKATPTPGLNSDKDSASSGMPVKTRNTVIGVVVGIGGAILLGAAAMVAYRIWGRRKHSEESDGLMSYDMSTNGYEKHEPSNSISSSNQRTPFQSTLENYHQPAGVNPSSNF